MRRAFPFLLLVCLAACSKTSTPASESKASDSGTPGAAAPPAAGAAAPNAAAPATPPGGRADDPPPPSAFVKPIPAELPNVIARINGETVNKSELQEALTVVERQNGTTVPPTERDRILRALLDELIGFKLLLQESQTRKVAVSDKELDERMTAIKQRFPSEEAFKTELTNQKVTLDQVRNMQRQQIMVQKLLEAEVGPKAAVTATDIEKAYKENPTAFQLPDQVHASHILITVSQDADAAAKAEALAKAMSVLKSARAGKDFAGLAKEFSQDPGSAAQGGDLGFFAAGQMVPQFSDAAFKLKPGTISDVVETQFGYHIIKVIEKRPGRTVKLEEARPQIEKQLQQVNRNRETAAFVQALRQKGKIEVFI